MVDAQTSPEVDQVLARLRQKEGDSIVLSRDDARWLLAEIDGGREAFGTLVQQKRGLEQQVAQMRRTIDDLSSLLRKKN